jgi:hypothetical protein
MPTYPETVFDEIVARFADKPQCDGSPGCTRPASWRIDLHGCEQAIMCAQHKSAWLRDIRANAGQPRCVHCGRVFDDVSAAVSVITI